MAKIEDALPNEIVKDEIFQEKEVLLPNNEEVTTTEDVNVTMDEDGGAEVNFDPNATGTLQSDEHFSNLAEVMDE